MLILLPPSEGKAAPRRGRPLDLAGLGYPELGPARRAVLEALVGLCRTRADAAEVLGLGPTQIGEVDHNAAILDAPAARADRVYSGVLYDALDAASLTGAAKRRASTQLLIASALFGWVRPSDRIPSYRLSGDTRLPGLGSVSGHWRRELAGWSGGTGLLVDLRSQQYAAFWRTGVAMADQVATVRVLQERAGRRTVVSHFNKATKGRLVRALLIDGARPGSPADLAQVWRRLGWQVDEGTPGPHGTRLDVVVTEV